MTRVLNIIDEVWDSLPGGVLDGVHMRRPILGSAYSRVYVAPWAARWLQEHARRRAVAMRRNRELSRHRRLRQEPSR